MNEHSSAASVRVKVCGIMRVEDGLSAARLGADFLGYIFFPKSSRNMQPEGVREIVREIRAQFPDVRHVGVMVNETVEAAATLVTRAGLDFAQLHGNETPDMVDELTERGFAVIKALRFGAGSPDSNPMQFRADYFLCDTYDPASAGGTGRAFDHSLLPPDLPKNRTFLAGGLTAQNVAGAIAAVHPFAVDVSSGVEEAPGRKSLVLLERFLRTAKA